MYFEACEPTFERASERVKDFFPELDVEVSNALPTEFEQVRDVSGGVFAKSLKGSLAVTGGKIVYARGKKSVEFRQREKENDWRVRIHLVLANSKLVAKGKKLGWRAKQNY